MTSKLHHGRDEVIEWIEAPDDLLSFVVDEATYSRVSFSIWFGRAHARLTHRVEELCAEFRAHDPSWAGGRS